MGVTDKGNLLHLYYGPKAEGLMSYKLQFYDRGFAGNPYDAGDDRTYSLDVLPQEYPGYGNGDYRSTAFNMRTQNGTDGTDLRYVSHRFIDEKFGLDGLPAVHGDGQTLEVILEDKNAGIQVELLYGIIPDKDTITRAARIRNVGDDRVVIDRAFSTSLDLISGNWDFIHFAGRHASERHMEREAIGHSKVSIGSLRGTSSHQHSPYLIIADEETGEDHGSAYGMTLLYSGNFRAEAEKDQFGLTRVMIGLQDEMFNYPLEPGEVLETPEVAMVYSAQGFSGLSKQFHTLTEENIIRSPYANKRRPVLINNWEATYFDFDGEKIFEIAEEAANLGVEMMVLDDGWFGKRDTDNAGLGDWYVNEDKLGGSLRELSDRIHGLGMKFGLWIEPEMVNEDSDLYREHPDWAFQIPGRAPVRGRNQLVLDFSREEVVDAVFDQIASVLDEAGVEYVKMDMNRSINDVYSLARSEQSYGKTMYDYVKGVYRFLDKLIERYPDLLIEGCSGGGGRFDSGMLYYTPQIWCSDNTDAIERIDIQYGTSFVFPTSSIGSHVSACPNEQTGRIVPINTRSVVAQGGTFGYELDLNEITDEEKEAVRQQIKDYKTFWPLITRGDYQRLTDPTKNREFAAWAFMADDQSEALVSAVTLTTHGNAPVNYVRLRGLKPEGLYQVTEMKGEAEPLVLSGSVLMLSGLPIPIRMGEYNAWQWHVKEMNDETVSD